MDNVPVRKRNRLENYDYSQPGAYYVTICTLGHQPFGVINLGSGRPEAAPTSLMQLSPLGKIVEAEITRLSHIYDGVYVDSYIVMPNHVHMIIVIRSNSGRAQPAPTVSRMIQQWKGAISKKTNNPIWQKGFYDKIIRNNDDYQRIVWEIRNNPATWEQDEYYVGNNRSYAAPQATGSRRGGLCPPGM